LLVMFVSAAAFPAPSQAFHLAPPPLHNPVLIVPGITGTEIYKGSDLLWPNVLKMADPVGSDSFMDPLAFKPDLQPLDTSVLPGAVIGLIKPIPLPGLDHLFKFDYTDGLINQLKTEGYQENEDIFTFPYDWRFGVARNAQLLQVAIANILSRSNADKIDVIAHSYGGLVVKKYIMDTGSPRIDKAVFVGTPNLGAPWAVKTLLAGSNLDIPLLSPAEIQKISHNMPAVYDLAPSRQYVNKQGSYLGINTRTKLFSSTTQNLDYNDTENYLTGKGLNSLGIAEANQLHSAEYDNYDPKSRGVDPYNIVGCTTGTMDQLVERKSVPALPLVNGYAVSFSAGDGTVPLASADNIPTDGKVFYVKDADHAKMLGQDGTRQEIVKIISGDQSIQPGPNISQDSTQCKLTGQVISIFSPVNITATDQNGNTAEVLADGSVQNSIPDSRLEVVGDHKFLYLPEDSSQAYKVRLTGTDNGTFTLSIDTIAGDALTSTSTYSDIPVTVDSSGQLDLKGKTLLDFGGKKYHPKVKKEHQGRKGTEEDDDQDNGEAAE